MTDPDKINTTGGVLTPINPPQDQYGPVQWTDNLMMRKDDKPVYTQVNTTPVAPGFGRGV